jgi:hypothetical protein
MKVWPTCYGGFQCDNHTELDFTLYGKEYWPLQMKKNIASVLRKVLV